MQFKIEGLEVITGTDQRVTLHKLADGSTMPLVAPPSHGEKMTSEANYVAGVLQPAVRAFGNLEAVRRTAALDKTLSELGREQKVKPAREEAQRSLSEAQAQVDRLGQGVALLRDQAFAPPVLEMTDINGGRFDQELREGLRAMTVEERAAYMQGLEKKPRHLEAILRSPLPIDGVSEYADRLWRESRERSPEAIKATNNADAHEWGAGTLRTLGRKI